MAKKSEAKVAANNLPEGLLAEKESLRKYALNSAIAILTPSVGKLAKNPRHQLDRHIDIEWPENEQQAKQVCEDLANGYARRIESERTSPRLSELIAKLEKLIGECQQFGKRLREISVEEKQLLAGAFRPERPDRGKLISSERELMLRTYSGSIRDGWRIWDTGTENLIFHLSLYEAAIRGRIDRARTDFRLREERDVGGPDSIYLRFNPDPKWWLAHHCWVLFSYSNDLHPSAYDDGKLREFLGTLHEAVTGEEVTGGSKFKDGLTKLAGEFRKREAAFSKLAKLAEKYQLPADEYAGAWSEHFLKRHFARQEDLIVAKKLQQEIDRAQQIIDFGHRIVKRASVPTTGREPEA